MISSAVFTVIYIRLHCIKVREPDAAQKRSNRNKQFGETTFLFDDLINFPMKNTS